MTVSISDMTVPESKPKLIEDAQATVDRIAKNYRRGLITEEERYKEVIETWKNTDDQLTHDLLTGLDKYNNIYMMADSGARGSDKQIKQLAGMRGLSAVFAADRPADADNFYRSDKVEVQKVTFKNQ